MATAAKPAKKAPKMTAVDKAVAAIRAGIRDGTYAPGQRLIEADVTEAVGISRGPLREAMWRLAGEGLVRIEPNRGVVVRKLTRDETRHLFQLREVLEGLAARLAAERVAVGDNRERFQKVAKAGDKCARGNDLTGYIEANEAFHAQIVAMSGNEMLSTLLNQLRVPLFRLQFKRLISSREAMKDSSLQHDAVVEAILAGQAAQAERAMRRHINESGQRLDELPDSCFG